MKLAILFFDGADINPLWCHMDVRVFTSYFHLNTYTIHYVFPEQLVGQVGSGFWECFCWLGIADWLSGQVWGFHVLKVSDLFVSAKQHHTFCISAAAQLLVSKKQIQISSTYFTHLDVVVHCTIVMILIWAHITNPTTCNIIPLKRSLITWYKVCERHHQSPNQSRVQSSREAKMDTARWKAKAL